MKKILLLSLVICISFLGFAQERVVVSKALRNVTKTANFERATDGIVNMGVAQNPYVTNTRELDSESTIGRTFYDLQTNASLSNRIHVYDDGTIGAVWTRGMEASSFANRGTGYNFFDGATWGDEPEARVEDERVGWPSYAPLGENGEIIIAHLADGLKISTRPDKGTGNWSFQTIESPAPASLTWPRMITGGEDNTSIHLIVNSYNEYEGQTRALFYYRSLDAGETWDTEAEILEGTGSDYYSEINADSYVWAEENGGAIAFLVGSAWSDLFMMKSTDNGDSWAKTVIWEHPYPFFDWEATIADTFYCVDNSASITLDYNGMAHVVFGINRVMHLELGTTYNYFPYVDGIGYWNETMPTFSNNHHALSPYSDDPESELTEDYNLIGWAQDTDGSGTLDFLDDIMSYRELGISTMPSISTDEYGSVILAFSSTTEGYDNTFFNYKHIWLRGKVANAWGEFEDINTNIIHMFDECVYPVIAQNLNAATCGIDILYQADFDPGIAFDEDHEYIENRMIVAHYDWCVGIDEQQSNYSNVTISQNTPNPAINSTSIEIKTEVFSRINLTIVNLLGQVVHHESVDNNSHTHTFEVDVTNLDSGIYFYTVEIGNNSVTKKMLVK